MIWFVAAVAAAVLIYALIRTMRQYEQESAVAALEQVAQLTELTMDLERRIENLEAIATSVDAEEVGSEQDHDAGAHASRRTPTGS